MACRFTLTQRVVSHRVSNFHTSSSTLRFALWENAHRSLTALGVLLATAGGALPPVKENRRCLRFQTPDFQLQIQDEDLTYVEIPAPHLQCWTEFLVVGARCLSAGRT